MHTNPCNNWLNRNKKDKEQMQQRELTKERRGSCNNGFSSNTEPKYEENEATSTSKKKQNGL